MRLWLEKTWVIILFVLFFPPIGIFLMWKYSSWSDRTKIIITGLAITDIILFYARVLNK